MVSCSVESSGDNEGTDADISLKPETSHAPVAGKAAPGLHVVSVPIGNLQDITLRAMDTLASVDLIACEDTRVSGKLLSLLGITGKLQAYHDHNAASVRPKLVARLRDGGSVALVSDAGTPLISDPGFKLVADARAAGVPVTAAPGPSAVLTALAVAGLPTDRFLFAGFAPAKAAARKAWLAEILAVRATVVLFEAARRLGPLMSEIAATTPDRGVVVTRELTKKFEEVTSLTAAEAAARYAGEAPKGEVTIVLAPPSAEETELDDSAVDRELGAAMAQMSLRDAANHVATLSGRPRREIYQRGLAMRETAAADDAATDENG